MNKYTTIQIKKDTHALLQEYCREHGISFHIDDTLIYNDFFTTPFTRLWTHNNKPKAPSKDVRHFK